MAKKKVLLMDDDAIIRMSSAHGLTDIGYEVESVTNGTEATDLYKKAIKAGSAFEPLSWI